MVCEGLPLHSKAREGMPMLAVVGKARQSMPRFALATFRLHMPRLASAFHIIATNLGPHVKTSA